MMTLHKSTWSADETPFISVVSPLGAEAQREFYSIGDMTHLPNHCYSSQKQWSTLCTEKNICESNKPQNPWSALDGSLVLCLQQGCPPHPYTAHPCLMMKMPPLWTQQPRGSLIRLDTQTAATQTKAAKHTWLVKKPVNYIDRVTRVIKRIHAAFTFLCFTPTVEQRQEPATPTPLITIISEMVGFDSLVPCAFN